MISGPGIPTNPAARAAADQSIPSPQILTQRLILRALAPADRAEFIRMHTVSETHFAPYLPTLADLGANDYAELFDRQLQRTHDGLADGSCCRLVAFLRESPTPRLVGSFNLNNIIRGMFQNADAGWHVSADMTRNGFATEAMSALLRFAFLPLPPGGPGATPPQWSVRHGLALHRVQAGVIPTNTPSIRVAEKIGLRREGLAQRYLRIAGRWQDHIIFALTAEELVR